LICRILIRHTLRSSLLLSIIVASPFCLAAQTQPSDQELQFVVIVSRHGVRSPTGKTDQLNQYSSQPWPAWSVPPGYLTEHGARLMTIFGAYDRAWLVKDRLLSDEGCADAEHITILADSDQRTRETGKALAAGLMPACAIAVHALDEGTPDPLFHPLQAGVGRPDKLLATAAVSGRIGGNPAGLVEAYRPQLQAMEEVLTGCNSGAPCASSMTAHPRASLFDLPSSIAPGKGDHLVELRTPLGISATLSENLLLEYTEGMNKMQVGWGRVNEDKLRELLQLHTASSDLERRTGYLAREQASNLLAHILDSMRQAISQKPVAGALTRPVDKLLVLVGHDTNLANIAGDLNLSWLIDGRRDDTPPGGALIFELWKSKSRMDQEIVRAFYTTQTLDQMRDTIQLTLATPPERVPLFIPGCGLADESCTWATFLSTVTSAIDPDAVR
jgi:4-phytase/acid phosphatase